MSIFSAPADQEFELVTLRCGVRSLRLRANGETFHPVIGPMAEARTLHVAGSRIVERAAEKKDGAFVVWDIGLGAAANAIAVIEALCGVARHAEARVELHSFDHTTAPLEFALTHAAELGYPAPHTCALRHLMKNHQVQIGSLRWQLHLRDFRAALAEKVRPAPDAVMFDPYSPQSNPTMWSLECFCDLRSQLARDTPCLLTSYTRSTAVRVTLLLAGFFVGCGGQIGEKDETTLASNHVDLLDAPLDAAWLERVRRSTRSAPLRDATRSNMISEEEFSNLQRHPQFQHEAASLNDAKR